MKTKTTTTASIPADYSRIKNDIERLQGKLDRALQFLALRMAKLEAANAAISKFLAANNFVPSEFRNAHSTGDSSFADSEYMSHDSMLITCNCTWHKPKEIKQIQIWRKRVEKKWNATIFQAYRVELLRIELYNSGMVEIKLRVYP